MKRLISLTTILIFILTVVLSSCVNNMSNTSDTNTSDITEVSSFEESSEATISEESFEPYESSHIDDSSETESITDDESSEYEESSISGESSNDNLDSIAEVIANNRTVEIEEVYRKYNKNNKNPYSIPRITKDYCICGTEIYEFSPHYYPEALTDYTAIYSILGNEEFFDYYSGFLSRYPDNRNYDYLPIVYVMIQELEIAKDEYVAAMNDTTMLTDKQIELLFGGYDEEIIKQELKRETVFYFEEKLYDPGDLQWAFENDKELCKRMLQDDSFKLYWYEVSYLYKLYSPAAHAKLVQDIYELRTELEAEAEE